MNDNTFGTGELNEDTIVPVEKLNYEQARSELIEVVSILERGQMSLDESLTYWERGEALAKRCEEHLNGAAQRVEDAIHRASGAPAASPEAGRAGTPPETAGTPPESGDGDEFGEY